MSDEAASAINLAVDLIVTSIFIGTFAVLMMLANQIGRTQQAEVDAVKVVQEYRKLNQYDGTTVYPQDVINYIFETRGIPEVWVDTDPTVGENFEWKWTSASAPSAYTAASLASLLPVSGTYNSQIVYDLNGAVIRIEFRR